MGGYLGQIKNLLSSNASINSLKQGLRGIADKRIAGSEYLSKEYGKETTDWKRLKSLYKHSDGSTNYGMWGGTIAGGYMGVSAAGRVATGGGAYRDSDGNFDIIGIPII